MKKSRFLTHSPVNFVFNKSSKDFTVEEIPLYEFSGSGEHLVLTIRKKDMTTWEMLNVVSSCVGVKLRDIGYAGLKDKDGMTIQSISIPKNFESALDKLEHSNIKLLSVTKHNNKIKLGHLKGNRFFMRLKKVMPSEYARLKNALNKISNEGMPNYFGYQRFGKFGDNHVAGKEIVEGKRKERNQNVKKFLISAYQSYLFNEWLGFRIDLSRLIESFDKDELKKAFSIHLNTKNIILDSDMISALKKQKQFLKIIDGDAMCHYPHGKLFNAENANEEAVRFALKQVSLTGLLCGEKNRLSAGHAYEIEKEFLDGNIKSIGDRRYAWIFPENCEIEYEEEEAHAKIRFVLPKGAYATSLLEEIGNIDLTANASGDFFDE